MSSNHSIHSLTPPMASHPASQEPGSGVSAPKEEETCAICLQALSARSLAAPSGAPLAHPANLSKQLECGHIFHQACIQRWCKEHPNCPMCNHSVVVPVRPPPPTPLTATAHRRRCRRTTVQPNKTGQRHPTANRGPVIHTLHTSGATQPHNTVGGGRLRVGRLGGGIRKSRVRRTTGVGPSSTK
jgi:RING-H2 zinc finger domain